MDQPDSKIVTIFPAWTISLAAILWWIAVQVLAELLHRPDLNRWIIGALFPAAWLATFVIHWLIPRRRGFPAFMAACRGRFLQQPARTIFYVGCWFIVCAWAADIALRPSRADRDLVALEVVALMVAGVALVGGFFVRRAARS
jgi:hypothetical protein